MTRETKIGLFVGMGVIILIGILISDHLSVAQRQQQPDFGQAFPESRQAGLETVSGVLPGTEQPLPAPGQVDARPAAAQRAVEAHPPADRLRVDLPKAIANLPGEKPVVAPIGSQNVLPPGGQTGPFQVVQDQALSQAEIQKISQRLGTAAANQSTHTVQEGETLSEIARRYYGRTAEWHTIYDANRVAIGDPDSLKPGTRLTIPNLASANGPSTDQVAAAPRPRKETAEYTFKRGDTLASVAEEFLGSQGKWRDLHDMNKDRIKDPNRISPGTVIRVPAR